MGMKALFPLVLVLLTSSSAYALERVGVAFTQPQVSCIFNLPANPTTREPALAAVFAILVEPQDDDTIPTEGIAVLEKIYSDDPACRPSPQAFAGKLSIDSGKSEGTFTTQGPQAELRIQIVSRVTYNQDSKLFLRQLFLGKWESLEISGNCQIIPKPGSPGSGGVHN